MKHAVVLLCLAAMPLVAGAQPMRADPLPEARGSTIGYPNVAAALADLRRKPGVTIDESQDGMVIVHDLNAIPQTHWTFILAKHPAAPAAIKRMVVEENGHVDLRMKVLCQASKTVCDKLVRDFQAMNESAAASLREPAP